MQADQSDTPPFLFVRPAAIPTVSDAANTAIQVGAIAGRLFVEERTRVYAPDGRRENVAEHSNMLAMVAPALAEQYMPQLDANLIARFAAIHDVVEAYVGDTPTDRIDHAGWTTKAELEARGFAQLKIEYAHLPRFVELIQAYEEQEVSEARFVRMVDKLMPLLVHINDDCAGLIMGEHIPEAVLKNSHETAMRLRESYPDMELIIALREELAEVVANRLGEVLSEQQKAA